MGKSPIIIYLSLCLLISISFVANSATLTKEQINKLSKEKARILPAKELFSAVGISDKEFIFLVENMLLDLRYLFKRPTGKPSTELTAAIKQFQLDIGHKQTGILLAEEFEELGKRYDLIGFIPIYPSSTHILRVGNLVSAKGTWVFEKDSIANPIQTTDIICQKTSGKCWVATAEISMNSGNAYLSVDIEEWIITKWNDYEVQAENDNSRCVNYTLTINTKNKEAYMFRRGKGISGCEGIAESPSILKLVDGFDVGYKYYHERLKKRSEILSSAFRKQINDLSK
jgi:hypothetical protein